MSEHRRAVTHPTGSPVPRRRRWLLGAAGALSASGLILGCVGIPVSADDVIAGAGVHAMADVSNGCLTATAGTGEVDSSVIPQQDAASQLQAAGQATATVSVCADDLGGGTLPGDPGGFGPGDIDEIVPDNPGGSVGGDLVGDVTASVEDELPGDGDGPGPGDPGDPLPGGLGDALPGGLGDVLPGGLGGLVPAGSGLVPGILDRLPMATPGIDDGESGGNDGHGPAINPSVGGTTSTSGSVTVGGIDAERGGPAGHVPGDQNDPIGTGAITTLGSPGTELPRTGGGLGTGVLRLIAFLGFGRATIGLVYRRQRSLRVLGITSPQD